jgi:transcriptional regulator with XRE-family HTH domain
MLGADLVREARRRAGLTQRELAERAETTQSAVARLESGRTRPSFDQVLRLIRLCGFRLHVSLDPYDDSDIAQAEALLRLPMEARLDRLIGSVSTLRELQDEVAGQRG